jgi:hypothetical protein
MFGTGALSMLLAVLAGGCPGGGGGGNGGTGNGSAGGNGAPRNGAAVTDPTVNPAPVALPRWWSEPDVTTWAGKPWRAVPLFGFMPRWPKDMDAGTRYVTFYRRSCEHCEAMFNDDLAPNPALAAMVVAIEVPETTTKLRTDEPWAMPENACTHMELPLGPDWIMTTPITLRIENGVVACAQEGGHTECMKGAGGG